MKKLLLILFIAVASTSRAQSDTSKIGAAIDAVYTQYYVGKGKIIDLQDQYKIAEKKGNTKKQLDCLQLIAVLTKAYELEKESILEVYKK